MLNLRTNGTPEQVDSFPKSLFLWRFVRDWNTHHSDPNFNEDQLLEVARFDKAEADRVSAATTTSTTTTTAPRLPRLDIPEASTRPPRPLGSSSLHPPLHHLLLLSRLGDPCHLRLDVKSPLHVRPMTLGQNTKRWRCM